MSGYLPTDINIPEDPAELRRFLDDILRQMIEAINSKDNGTYDVTQQTNGQKWFDPANTQNVRNTQRKVINFGALLNTAAKSVAHGITTTATTVFTRISAYATDPAGATINQAITIPSANVEIHVDATNVVITTAADFTAYTNCYVVLEWVDY